MQAEQMGLPHSGRQRRAATLRRCRATQIVCHM